MLACWSTSYRLTEHLRFFIVLDVQVMCLSVAVANVEQSKEEVELNVQLAANFLASLLKKNWQNIKVQCDFHFGLG